MAPLEPPAKREHTPGPALPGPFVKGELEFRDLLSLRGRSNADRLGWWASTLSSRNYATSQLWDHLQRFLEAGRPPSYPGQLKRLFSCMRYQTARLLRLSPRGSGRAWSGAIERLAAADLVFVTHLDERIRRGGDGYRDDYWQCLLERASGRGLRVALVGHVTSDSPAFADHLLGRASQDPPVVPLQAFVRLRDIPWAVARAITARIDLPPEAPFRGRDIGPAIASFFDWERRAGALFTELLFFPAWSRLVRATRARAILWPWENHSWERLLLIARRQENPRLATIGHQHATLPLSLVNHFPGKAELDYAPFPDRIVTTGPVTREILETYGHFPPGCLEVGCAVRYPPARGRGPRAPRVAGSPVRLGVALTTELPDCLDVLRIVGELLAATGREAVVKCHPTLPAPILCRHLPSGALPHGCRLYEGPTLDEFLASIDVLAHGKTSVSFEAIARGVPVIHVCAPGNEIDDPLSGCPAFRWRATGPDTLRERLNEIESTDGDVLRRQAAQALAYVRSYLVPPSPEALDRILDATARGRSRDVAGVHGPVP